MRLRPGLLLVVFGACLASCSSSEPKEDPVVPWTPGTVYRAADGNQRRSMLDLRGLIHAHSAHSHDACDGEPVKDGVFDQQCLSDFRDGFCKAQHDFVFLTDHKESFADIPFVEALLHRADLGDTLVERDGGPRASWAACPDESKTLILAGFESGTMTVGLTHHLSEDRDTRADVYGATTPEAMEMLKKDVDAVVLLQHTEDWTVDELSDWPIDGFEMYNLHANTVLGAGPAFELIFFAAEQPENLPAPDLVAVPIWSEDARYLERWGSVLARGKKRVTTIGTDCHQNTFRAKLPDGERGDSYRRMMIWMSNHLLVRPEADGSWDDRHLKEALKAGRLYGAFEVVGYPTGFDFRAEADQTTAEMGDEVALASAPTLIVNQAKLEKLDPTRTPPTLTTRILRAVDGGFEEVASGPGDLRFTPTQPGAYRAEVRMVPLHLKQDLGPHFRDMVLAHDMVWIYSNPIYVR